VRALNATNIADDIQFAWHGTPSHSGLIGISSSSWDPGRRNGQACGPGEYFSPSDTTSKSYAGGNGFLIVCALLKKSLKAHCVATTAPRFHKERTRPHMQNDPSDLRYMITSVSYGATTPV